MSAERVSAALSAVDGLWECQAMPGNDDLHSTAREIILELYARRRGRAGSVIWKAHEARRDEEHRQAVRDAYKRGYSDGLGDGVPEGAYHAAERIKDRVCDVIVERNMRTGPGTDSHAILTALDADEGGT